MRLLPQISLCNLRKLDCYANRYPLRSKTLYPGTGRISAGRAGSRHKKAPDDAGALELLN
jgi:hypothetical protein